MEAESTCDANSMGFPKMNALSMYNLLFLWFIKAFCPPAHEWSPVVYAAEDSVGPNQSGAEQLCSESNPPTPCLSCCSDPRTVTWCMAKLSWDYGFTQQYFWGEKKKDPICVVTMATSRYPVCALGCRDRHPLPPGSVGLPKPWEQCWSSIHPDFSCSLLISDVPSVIC